MSHMFTDNPSQRMTDKIPFTGKSPLLDRLCAALSAEWLAYYRYWAASRTVVCPQFIDLPASLLRHAAGKLRHAKLLCRRIIELGGRPEVSFADMRPASFTSVCHGLEQFLKSIRMAEEDAMIRYQEIADLARKSDKRTCSLADEILLEEARSEQHIQDLLYSIGPRRRRLCRNA